MYLAACLSCWLEKEWRPALLPTLFYQQTTHSKHAEGPQAGATDAAPGGANAAGGAHSALGLSPPAAYAALLLLGDITPPDWPTLQARSEEKNAPALALEPPGQMAKRVLLAQ